MRTLQARRKRGDMITITTCRIMSGKDKVDRWVCFRTVRENKEFGQGLGRTLHPGASWLRGEGELLLPEVGFLMEHLARGHEEEHLCEWVQKERQRMDGGEGWGQIRN
eukprot:GFUD01071489.1.p1 GENE.GFUD01071489.1~~GFUD01071489.1.p1  ORF type:complete len:108 (+),score=24.17 GFUD01071489.1:75-398(+)